MMWNPNITYRPERVVYKNFKVWNKRKIPLEILDELPSKIHISEEKMVSQLNSIHLSNDFTSHGLQSSTSSPSSSSSEISCRLPKLTMCDELKSIEMSRAEEILPKSIIERPRSSNALVLWEPPSGNLGLYLSQVRSSCKLEESKEKDEKENDEEDETKDVDMEDNNNNNSTSALNFQSFTRTI